MHVCSQSWCLQHLMASRWGMNNGGGLWVFMLQTKVLAMQKKSTCSSSFPSNQYVAFLGQPSMQLCKWVFKWSFPRKKFLGWAHAWPPLACNGHFSSFFFILQVKFKILKDSVFKYFFLNSIFFLVLQNSDFQFPKFQFSYLFILSLLFLLLLFYLFFKFNL